MAQGSRPTSPVHGRPIPHTPVNTPPFSGATRWIPMATGQAAARPFGPADADLMRQAIRSWTPRRPSRGQAPFISARQPVRSSDRDDRRRRRQPTARSLVGRSWSGARDPGQDTSGRGADHDIKPRHRPSLSSIIDCQLSPPGSLDTRIQERTQLRQGRRSCPASTVGEVRDGIRLPHPTCHCARARPSAGAPS